MISNAQPPGGLLFALLDEEVLRDFADFSCGDEAWQADLREFLLDDAISQSRGRFSVTFVFYTASRDRSVRSAIGGASRSEGHRARDDAVR